MTILLSAADLARCLDPGSVAPTVERACAAYTSGLTDTPLRAVVHPHPSATAPSGGAAGVLLTMPCAVAGSSDGDPAALGVKVVAVFPDNRARRLPTVTSLYVLLDDQTGAPLAVADGTYLTATRTAAASAVATRYLALPDAGTLGVFGTGVQARFHVDALRRVRPIRQVLVAGTSSEKAAAFARWVTESTGLAAAPAAPEDVSAADVVATCTTSATPVVVGDRVQPGTHLNAVGAFTPQMRELDGDLVARARVYVDTRAGASAEAGDLLLAVAEGCFALQDVAGELGEVILGRVDGRRSTAEVTVYKSVGAAFLDACTARLAYDRALAAGIGQPFAFA